jgi:hypothetical protein
VTYAFVDMYQRCGESIDRCTNVSKKFIFTDVSEHLQLDTNVLENHLKPVNESNIFFLEFVPYKYSRRLIINATYSTP